MCLQSKTDTIIVTQIAPRAEIFLYRFDGIMSGMLQKQLHSNQSGFPLSTVVKLKHYF